MTSGAAAILLLRDKLFPKAQPVQPPAVSRPFDGFTDTNATLNLSTAATLNPRTGTVGPDAWKPIRP